MTTHYKGIPNRRVPVKWNTTSKDLETEFKGKYSRTIDVSDTYTLGAGGSLTISGSYIDDSCQFYLGQRPGGATSLSIDSIATGSVTVAGTNAGNNKFDLQIRR